MRIDVHNHVIPERALAVLQSRPAYGVNKRKRKIKEKKKEKKTNRS